MEFKILGRDEKKKIIEYFRNFYDLEEKFIKEIMSMQLFASGKEKIRIYSGALDLANIPKIQKEIVVSNAGLYLIKNEDGYTRLSFDGATMFGKYARKNVVTLTGEQVEDLFLGHNLLFEEEQKKNLDKGFIILKEPIHKDILGVGLFNGNELLNYLPKERRISSFEYHKIPGQK